MNICASVASSHKKTTKKKTKAASAAVTASAGLSVDSGFLCCAHHEVMVAGLSMLDLGAPKNKDVPVSVLLVGLGGGGLPQFLRDFVPNATVEVVELDPVVLEVAKEWFQFRPDDRLTVTLGDGLERICSLEKEGGHLFDVIMFDVDNKDSSLGMSCPPAAFVETSVLQKVSNILSPRGLFILNLVCRDPVLRKSVLERVRSVFPMILSQNIAEEINEVLLCFRDEKDATHTLESLSQTAKNFQSTLSSDRTEPKRRPRIDIAEVLKDLKLE